MVDQAPKQDIRRNIFFIIRGLRVFSGLRLGKDSYFKAVGPKDREMLF